MFDARSVAALAVAHLLLYGSASIATAADATEARRTDQMTIRLAATRYNAGELGMAVLVPSGNETVMTIQISGVPNHTTRPVHLSAAVFDGSCGSRTANPVFTPDGPPLAHSLIQPAAIGAQRGPSRIIHTLPVAFEALRAMPFAISVRLRPADGNFELFCGDNAP
jgi:hypothetical protein